MGDQTRMLLGADVVGLVDQKHRYAVLDAVGLAKSRVVKDVAGVDQGPAVGGTDQDLEKLRIESHASHHTATE